MYFKGVLIVVLSILLFSCSEDVEDGCPMNSQLLYGVDWQLQNNLTNSGQEIIRFTTPQTVTQTLVYYNDSTVLQKFIFFLDDCERFLFEPKIYAQFDIVYLSESKLEIDAYFCESISNCFYTETLYFKKI